MVKELIAEYWKANDDDTRMGLWQKILRELKWNHVQEHLIPILDDLDYMIAVDRSKGSMNIYSPDEKRFIYFPLKDRLLITSENDWKSRGLNWMRDNISDKIESKYFDIEEILSDYQE
jgi:hypothetical protein